MPAVLLDPPAVLDWEHFYELERRENGQGEHRLFIGPTQSGKTTLCRKIAALRSYVVVLGTKNKDTALDAYIIEGYKRIMAWPPTKKEIDEATQPDGSVRFILWPKFNSLHSLDDPKIRQNFVKLFEQAYNEGYWTIVCDESLWLAARDGLALDGVLAKMAFASASNKVSLYLCMQRPSGISRTTWSNATDAYVFHMGVTNDLRELASLGTYSPKDAREVIQGLKGKNFLKMPIRGGAQWTISQVSPQAAQPSRSEFSTTAA